MPTYELPVSLASFTTDAQLVAQLLVAGQHALHPQAMLAEQRLELRGRLAGEPAALDLLEAPVLHELQRAGTSFAISWRSV